LNYLFGSLKIQTGKDPNKLIQFFLETPKIQTSNSILFGNTKKVIQDYDTVFDNSIPFRKMTYYGLEYRACRACTLCLVTETPAPVTGAAADEYNLNVVDCNASVTVARPEVLNLSQWGSGGYPQRAGGKLERERCVWFSVASPGTAGNFFQK